MNLRGLFLVIYWSLFGWWLWLGWYCLVGMWLVVKWGTLAVAWIMYAVFWLLPVYLIGLVKR